MKLSRVRRTLTRRLAYLSALLVDVPHLSWAKEERDALETILRCQGMLDEERVAIDVERCSERVLPHVVRQHERAERGDRLRAAASGLVAAALAAGRVA